MKMKKVPVIAVGPSGNARRYQSIRAAARALSGTGRVTTSLNQVANAVKSGGGYVGKVKVAPA